MNMIRVSILPTVKSIISELHFNACEGTALLLTTSTAFCILDLFILFIIDVVLGPSGGVLPISFC